MEFTECSENAFPRKSAFPQLFNLTRHNFIRIQKFNKGKVLSTRRVSEMCNMDLDTGRTATNIFKKHAQLAYDQTCWRLRFLSNLWNHRVTPSRGHLHRFWRGEKRKPKNQLDWYFEALLSQLCRFLFDMFCQNSTSVGRPDFTTSNDVLVTKFFTLWVERFYRMLNDKMGPTFELLSEGWHSVFLYIFYNLPKPLLKSLIFVRNYWAPYIKNLRENVIQLR